MRDSWLHLRREKSEVVGFGGLEEIRGQHFFTAHSLRHTGESVDSATLLGAMRTMKSDLLNFLCSAEEDLKQQGQGISKHV